MAWIVKIDQIVQDIFDNCLSRQNVLTECLQTETWKHMWYVHDNAV